MIKLGITGNIACGKSLVGKYLESLGFNCIDSDQIVHQILSYQNSISQQIIDLCKPNSITSSNNSFIDRQKLGKLLFQNKPLLKQVENIIHPLVFQAINEFFDKEKQKKTKLAVALIPLLFETTSQKRFDYSWLIYCEPTLQKQRLKARNPDFTDKDIQLRINSQMSQLEKKKLADFIIDNSEAIEKTYSQINQILLNLDCL